MDRHSGEARRASFEARLAALASIRCMLEIVEFSHIDAPLLAKLLLAAVVDANLVKLGRDPGLQARYARMDTMPPDELRRPVSINALAASLRQPFETVRRHIRWLEARGLCVATPNGVYVPAAVLVSPPFVALGQFRYSRIRRLQEELCAAGALGDSMALPPLSDPGAPVRAVNRILSDFFLRMVEILQRHVRDPVTGLVLMGVIRGGTEHLSHDEAAALMRQGVIPSERRVPVRAAELSRRLRVPYETVRRHLGWLTEQGICERRAEGFVIPAALAERPETWAAMEENLVNLQRTFRQIDALVLAPAASRG
jgi:DNA-binding transcriptional ArsR family regulator